MNCSKADSTEGRWALVELSDAYYEPVAEFLRFGQRRENELSTNLGLMPINHYKNENYAAFVSAQSLQKPQQYEGPGGKEANANLAARLPYLLATCRFAHYLKRIVYDMIGAFKERDEMETYLNNWIMNYVSLFPARLGFWRDARIAQATPVPHLRIGGRDCQSQSDRMATRCGQRRCTPEPRTCRRSLAEFGHRPSTRAGGARTHAHMARRGGRAATR